MIFLNKISKNLIPLNTKYLYYIKISNDFIFFIQLIKEFIQSHNIKSNKIIKISIYLLNLLAIKYIFYIKYNNIYYKNNNNLFEIYNLELFYWKYKQLNNYLIKEKNILQKILFIKKISRTRSKGRVQRYKVLVLIGNKSGWFGIGSSKDFYLQKAISKARLHAFKHIYYISLFYSNLLKNNIYLQKKSKKIYLFSSKFKIKTSAYYALRVLFEFIGFTNLSSKIIGLHNIYNIISLFLKI